MIRAPFLTQLGPNDVLIGRGAPSNVNEGNRRYRELVLSRKDEYVAATKRQVKNQIAREIVHTITNVRRGHFVRRVESLVEAEELGIPEGLNAWAFVSLETAVQKTKQALRDQAVAAAKGAEAIASSTSVATTGTRTTLSAAVEAYKRQKIEAGELVQQRESSGLIGDYLRLARDARFPTASIPAPFAPYQLDGLRADVAMGHQHHQQQQMMSRMLPSTLPLPSSVSTSAMGHDFRPSSAFNPSPHPFHVPLLPSRSPPLEDLSAASSFRQSLYLSHPSSQHQMVHPWEALSVPPRPVGGSTATTPGGTFSPFQRELSSDVAPRGGRDAGLTASTPPSRSGKVTKAAKSGVRGSSGGVRRASSRPPQAASEKSPSPTPSSASSPTSSSVVVRDESTGEAALRVAVEIATGVRPKHPKQEFLELSLLEMHILSVACTLGIPSSSNTKTTMQPYYEGVSLTWEQVAAAIEFVARRWSENPPSPSSPTPQARSTGISLTAEHKPRGQDSPRRKDGARYAALRQAQELKTKPSDLIKTVVLLLGRVRSFGMSSGVSDRPLPLQPSNYEAWFLDELRRYVPALDSIVASQLETKRPASSLRSHEMTGLMDREDCRAVYAQVSCISRLRALFDGASAQASSAEAPTLSSWQSQVVAAASLCDKNKVWASRPGWWVTSAPSSSDEDDHGEAGGRPGAGAGTAAAVEGSAHSGDDIALLDMVLREAVFAPEQGSPLLLTAKESKASKGEEARLSASASLQRLGMSKAAVQERVSQLVEQLHQQYSVER